MELLYRHERMTANEVLAGMPSNVHNSTIRTQLRILEIKGHVGHDVVNGKFVFYPIHKREDAARTAFASIVNSLFKGSITQAVSMLISSNEKNLSKEELEEIESVLQKAKSNK